MADQAAGRGDAEIGSGAEVRNEFHGAAELVLQLRDVRELHLHDSSGREKRERRRAAWTRYERAVRACWQAVESAYTVDDEARLASAQDELQEALTAVRREGPDRMGEFAEQVLLACRLRVRSVLLYGPAWRAGRKLAAAEGVETRVGSPGTASAARDAYTKAKGAAWPGSDDRTELMRAAAEAINACAALTDDDVAALIEDMSRTEPTHTAATDREAYARSAARWLGRFIEAQGVGSED
ncbi:hypothetical protein ACIBKX_14910 [Streptomyces sp. NPDC050658]|uniref:hypothetical protein n=1 Tax=unclassified Streptomyces TaxID=2593676 RepID=UPI00341C0F3F